MGTDERAEDTRAENGALLLENEDEFEEFEVDGASRHGHSWCKYDHEGVWFCLQSGLPVNRRWMRSCGSRTGMMM